MPEVHKSHAPRTRLFNRLFSRHNRHHKSPSPYLSPSHPSTPNLVVPHPRNKSQDKVAVEKRMTLIEFEKENNGFINSILNNKEFKSLCDLIVDKNAIILAPHSVTLENIPITFSFAQTHIVYCNPLNSQQFCTLNGIRGMFTESFDKLVMLAGPPPAETYVNFLTDEMAAFTQCQMFEKIRSNDDLLTAIHNISNTQSDKESDAEDSLKINQPILPPNCLYHILRVSEIKVKNKNVRLMLISQPISFDLQPVNASEKDVVPDQSGALQDSTTNNDNTDSGITSNTAEHQPVENPDDKKDSSETDKRKLMTKQKITDAFKQMMGLLSTQTSSNLFQEKPEEIDDTKSISSRSSRNGSGNKVDALGAKSGANSTPPTKFTFHDFVDKMRHPSAANLVRRIKKFIDRVSSGEQNIEQLPNRVSAFLEATQNMLKSHILWKGATQQELENAREGLEKYLMTKLYSKAFSPTVDDLGKDVQLQTRLENLQKFIKPSHFDIPEKVLQDQNFQMAIAELQKVNQYKTPRDKVICISNSCKILFNILQKADKSQIHGADSFVPLVIFSVLHANPPYLHSNMKYISEYRDPNKMISESGYYFTVIQSAVYFWQHADPESLNIPKDEFDRIISEESSNMENVKNDTCTPGDDHKLHERSFSLSGSHQELSVNTDVTEDINKPALEGTSPLLDISETNISSGSTSDNAVSWDNPTNSFDDIKSPESLESDSQLKFGFDSTDKKANAVLDTTVIADQNLNINPQSDLVTVTQEDSTTEPTQTTSQLVVEIVANVESVPVASGAVQSDQSLSHSLSDFEFQPEFPPVQYSQQETDTNTVSTNVGIPNIKQLDVAPQGSDKHADKYMDMNFDDLKISDLQVIFAEFKRLKQLERTIHENSQNIH